MKKILFILCACSNNKEERAYTSVDDFEGKTIDVVASSMQEMSLKNYLNNISKKIADSTKRYSCARIYEQYEINQLTGIET